MNIFETVCVCPRCGEVGFGFHNGQCNICKIEVIDTNILVSTLTNDEFEDLKQELQKKYDRRISKPMIKKEYEQLCKKMKKPSDVVQLVTEGFRDVIDCWIENNVLIMLSSWKDIELKIGLYITTEYFDFDFQEKVFNKKISMENIKFFKEEGDMYTETKISGGGGGGISVKGALVGGIIAGGVGAVIGSREKVNPITSETIKHDERRIILYYYENDNHKTISQIAFKESYYNRLLTLIPEKEYSAVVAKTTSENSIETPQTILSPTEKIRELSKLKDEGILTEEEFIEKKKELLAKI